MLSARLARYWNELSQPGMGQGLLPVGLDTFVERHTLEGAPNALPGRMITCLKNRQLRVLRQGIE